MTYAHPEKGEPQLKIEPGTIGPVNKCGGALFCSLTQSGKPARRHAAPRRERPADWQAGAADATGEQLVTHNRPNLLMDVEGVMFFFPSFLFPIRAR